jgi:hypothetical protein
VRAESARRWFPREYVFLLSHMRSYSTVLSHVLGSSPEISGYAESQVKFRRRADLWRLRLNVARAVGGWPTGRYLLDKQLHNHQLLPRRWWELDVRALIFVRRPEPALASIRRLAAATRPGGPLDGWDAAAQYYCERLTTLASRGIALGPRALAFPAEEIVERPGPLLGRIEKHLGLGRPLSPEYRIRTLTGDAGHGDPSARIRAGRILAPGATDGPPTLGGEAPARIPERVLERCHAVHADVVRILGDWCPAHALHRAR